MEQINVVCANGTLFFSEEEYCDHCGKLEPFELVFCEDDGDAYWCRWCADSMHLIDDVDPDWIDDVERDNKIKYYKEQLQRLTGD